MYERTPRYRHIATAGALVATLVMSSTAEAQTGGATFDNAPAPVTAPAVPNSAVAPVTAETTPVIDKKGICPKPDKITSKNLTSTCRGLVMNVLTDYSVFDDADTTLRVAAYQAVTNVPGGVDGVVGPRTAKSVLLGVGLDVPSPDTSGTKKKKILVDKEDQVMYTLHKGKTTHVFKVSTGTELPYGDDGEVGDTPTGNFRIVREEPKNYQAPLGAMPYAHFINHKSGIAIHTGLVDPNGRDSHGCIRTEGRTMVRYIVPFKLNTPVTIVERLPLKTS